MAIKKDGHFITVQEHIIESQREHPTATGEFSWLLSAITLSTKIIASYVRRAGLIDVLGAAGHENIQGEVVQKLDIIANETLMRTFGYRDTVGIIASEEDNEPRVLQEVSEGGKYIVMFDPLDGSSNIDANVSIGTIFTIFGNPPEIEGAAASVLQRGRRQLAAGYVVYGSSTVLVYTTGNGVHMFTLDPQFGAYLLTRENVEMPAHAPQYSVNEAYVERFPEGYQQYLAWTKQQKRWSSRYIGSLVADFHRILLKGGVFLYPPTTDHKQGKLRLMYEANPLAFIAEQAGGAATDGEGAILDRSPTGVHDRTPLVIGSRDNVDEVMRFVEAGRSVTTR
ncbi:MAG: class 1 fructose-bisphosphatase [Phycisphaeraceae bacterium]